MDAAEAHGRLMTATGGLPPRPHQLADRPPEERLAGRIDPRGVNGVAAAMGDATSALETFADAVRKLVETAEEVVDDGGREVWMTAGEVELDQWTQRLTDAAAVVRRQLGT
jgi:hypothetical protein